MWLEEEEEEDCCVSTKAARRGSIMVGRWFLDNALFRGIVWNLESLNKCYYSVGVQNSEFRYVLVLVNGFRLNLCSSGGTDGLKASLDTSI